MVKLGSSLLALAWMLHGVSAGQYSSAVHEEPKVADPPHLKEDIRAEIHAFFEGTGCPRACAYLAFKLPDITYLRDSEKYKRQEANYWSLLQRHAGSECRVSPKGADDVSITLLTLEVTGCKFAVKSGGVSTPPQSSSISAGVVIDFAKMRAIELSEDKETVSLGPAALWGDVYENLEPHSLTVVGGRVSQVGVGGFILGGGVSYISNRYGWGCQNVRNYEAVFADGSIHNINKKTYPDLFWALCGGGNNFAIITRFDLITYPQDKIWAGTILYDRKTTDQGIEAFSEFARKPFADPDATVIYGFSYNHDMGMELAAAMNTYNKPVVDAPVLKPFTEIPSFYSSMNIVSIKDMCDELKKITPSGKFQVYHTLTIRESPEALKAMRDIFFEEVAKVKEIPGFVPQFMFQPITTSFLEVSERNGGNPFGLQAEDGPMVDCLLNFSWTEPKDINVMFEVSQQIMDRSLEAAKKVGAEHPFLYISYGAPGQHVLMSYGSENCQKLKEISNKYDPEQIFQSLQPGHHKLKCLPSDFPLPTPSPSTDPRLFATAEV